jgi:hypothetical protein
MDTGFHSQDLGFRTSINGHWVSLSGPGFQDVESSPSYGHLIFFPSLFSASTVSFLRRPVFPSLFSASNGHRRTDAPKRKAKNQRKEKLRPLLFPEENPFVCPSVRAGFAIENASRWSVIGRVGSVVENASGTPNHPTMDLVNLYIRFVSSASFDRKISLIGLQMSYIWSLLSLWRW